MKENDDIERKPRSFFQPDFIVAILQANLQYAMGIKMNKTLRRLIAVLLSICVVCSVGITEKVTAMAGEVKIGKTMPTTQAEVWKRTDLILTSDKEYTNPYLDVEIDAVFEHTDGTKIHLYGFWNGEDEWRVRFSPTKTGTWSYTVTSSDTSNTGLHNVSGKVEAVPNTGNTDLDRHGFVRISDNGRYFTYDDGTPFYWLGDTNWQAPNYVSTTQCNYPGCKCQNQFQHEVDDRLNKGFTVYQTYFDSGENDGGGQLATTSEPSLWLEKYNMINPDTFTDKIDGMFDYMADNGMVIALGYGVHSHTVNGMGQKAIEQISRYLTARYASYPVVWITAQEITGEPQFNVWKASAEIVDQGDGYNHPQGAHQFPTDNTNDYTRDLDKQPWHEWWGLQNGHGPLQQSKDLYKSYWDNEKVKPYLELEANYEDITCGGFNGYDASRISAWRTNLLGSYGFTYGVTGVWANNYSTAGNMGWYGSFSFEPWYMGLDKPGSNEMTYLRSFFEYVRFYELVPRFNDTAYSDCTAENKVVASTEDGKTYVAYFYNKDLSTGTLSALSTDEVYTARWYNPLTGKFVNEAEGITAAEGTYTIPKKPTSGDWVFLLTIENFGDYEEEAVYDDPFISHRENLAVGAAATASSDNSNFTSFAADCAVDGDYNTYWCADSGEMPQWLELDMGEPKSFQEINILMHRGMSTRTEKVSYHIQGSLDGENWEEIFAATDQKPTVVKNMDRLRITREGTYRYLRLEYTDITSNWAAVYEVEVFADKSPEEETDELENLAKLSIAEAGSESGTSTADKAVDGNSSTWWCADSGNMPQWLSLDLKEEQTFNKIRMYMYGGTSSVDYTILGSNDKEDWQPIYTGIGEKPKQAENSQSVFLDIPAAGTYRYLKTEFSKVEGNWATIVELEVYNDPALSNVNHAWDASATASSTSAPVSAPSKSVDGDSTTYWCASSGNMPQWIQYDLGESKKIGFINMYMVGGTSSVSYQLEGSDDGSNWSLITEETDKKTINKGGLSLVEIRTDCNYQYLKLTFQDVQGNWPTMTEFEVYSEEIAPPEDDEVPIYEGVMQTPLVKSVGSAVYTEDGVYSNTDSSLFDGDIRTEWVPYGPVGSQTIIMDLLQENVLHGIVVRLGSGSYLPKYRIEGSNNKTDWTILADATLRDPQVYQKDGGQAVYESLAGQYRYVKLLWLNAPGNSTNKQIGEIELYADLETPDYPQPAQTDEMQSLYSDWKTKNNNRQIYTKASWRALQVQLQAAGRLLMDPYASHEDVDGVTNELKAVVNGLEEKSDKKELQALVSTAEGKQEKDYTSQSWKVFAQALQAARNVLADYDAGKQIADQAYAVLYQAKQELVRVTKPNPPAEPVKVNGIKLNKTSDRLFVKDRLKLSASVSPADAKDRTVTWTSSNHSVAAVDASGNVTAKKKGSAVITAKANDGSGKSASCSVTVVKATVKLNAKSIPLQLKKSTKVIKASGLQKGDKIKSWSSSKKSVASVDKKGKITAKKTGNATITVRTLKGASAKLSVKVVKSKVTTKSIKADVSKLTLTKGKSRKLNVTRNPITATDKITFESSNRRKADVNKSGKITAKKRGRADITVKTANGKSYKVKVTVR